MDKAHTIILNYNRGSELVNDAHLFFGYIEVQDVQGQIGERYDFSSLPFRKMLSKVSGLQREYPDAWVVFRRTDRKGLRPLLLAEEMRVLLRDDPARCIQTMDVKLGEKAEVPVAAPYIRSNFDTLADSFGERVYIRMKNGAVEDPVTGCWSSLAYGPKCGWRIRGKHNSYEGWCPVRLDELQGIELPDNNLEEAMQGVSGELAKCRWASILVEDLLQQNANRFFLPRRWNTEAQWIGRNALKERLNEYLSEREEVKLC